MVGWLFTDSLTSLKRFSQPSYFLIEFDESVAISTSEFAIMCISVRKFKLWTKVDKIKVKWRLLSLKFIKIKVENV